MARSFDETELLERVDSDVAFLGDTVQMLESDGRALMGHVKEAIVAGDAAAVGRSAHALKGMISNFCAAGVQQLAFDIERMGKSGELASAPAAAATLETALEALISELREFVKART